MASSATLTSGFSGPILGETLSIRSRPIHHLSRRSKPRRHLQAGPHQGTPAQDSKKRRKKTGGKKFAKTWVRQSAREPDEAGSKCKTTPGWIFTVLQFPRHRRYCVFLSCFADALRVVLLLRPPHSSTAGLQVGILHLHLSTSSLSPTPLLLSTSPSVISPPHSLTSRASSFHL